MKNSKQTLVFNFNNVTTEHIYDDDDESSEVLIGKEKKRTPCLDAAVDFIYIN